MTANFVRTLKILVLLLFSFSCKSFATTYYVNINNPTPGTGLTWGSAFNDLNQALAVYSNGDQIWVAKGTYYPTATTDRTATFSITKSLNLYGGFNGTETAYTMANPTANPTILSGDIGISGNAADNSYHVVTFSGPGTSGLTMDGFTITGGNANQGYPASTTPSSSNTGGGFLELSTSNQFQSASITHCTFTSNFAVYGGGFGAYGDGNTSATFYNIVYCTFTNNAAFSGGAGASLGYNNDWSVSQFDMCVFTGNTCVSSQGSVIATIYTNGTTSDMLTMVTNCVLYNNPEPQLYNLATNGSGHLQIYTSIIWNSVAPYTGPLYTGNNVLVDMCDLDLVTPDGSNLDVDPQFTNPAAGDFHTPHCSPLVDQGWTTASFNIGHTDPDGNARLLGPKTDIGLYESQLPPYPTVTNAAYCQYATASPLTATALAGNTLLWYTGSTGGTGSATPITPSTSTASPFGTYYYVSQVDALGCEGLRYPIKVTINAAATAPTASSPIYCQSATATALTATGSNLLWYTTIGGTGSATAPIPVTTGTGSTDYYVTQTPAGSCESAPTTVTVTIKTGATAPTATSPTYCQGVAALALTATGSNLLWYTTIGGAGSATAPIPVTTGTGSTDYYVTQTPAGSCESSPTTVTVTIKTGATAPAASSPTYCQNVVAPSLTATGSNLLWYTTIGGTGSAIAPIPVTTGTGSTDYYVTQTPAGSCESSPTTVTVTIKTGATAPMANSPTYCQNVAAPSLTATGSNLLWYTAATGGAGDPASPVPSTASTGMTSYYVTQTPVAGGCESPRTEVDVTVNPVPSAEFTWSTPCEGKAATIKAGSATADQYTWDFGNGASASGSGAGPYEVTWATSNTYTVTLTATAGGCPGKMQHLITVYPNPKVDITAPTVPLCQGNNIPLEASGASSYQWSPATDLSNAGIANPVALLQSTIQYTVTGTDVNGCSAAAEITLDISPDCLAYYIPDAFTPNGDGRNDVFHIITADIPKSFTLMVFNRFGGKVFESSNIGNGWNGTIGGNAASTGTYVYVVQATTSAGTIVKKQGTIILIR